MSKTKLNAKLIGNMAFEMDMNGHKLITDGAEDVGGQNLGPRPKSLLLAGLIGCTGIDITLILKKMRVEYDEFNVEVEAEAREEDPKIYNYIHLIFKFKGKDLPLSKIERAVKLSQEKYCGVTAMLEKAVPITYEIKVEN